ncbi:MAG TPA: NAD(P)-dependent oxidoreductase [Terrimicrobiaceae bacterium]
MSETSVQSRKICFVEVEPEAKSFFDEAFAAHEVSFVDRLDAVPANTEVLSVFISERIEEAFLDSHSLIRLIATRSTGCDHIDLEACERRGVIVAHVGNYGENTVAEHAFALILALSRRLRDSEQAVRTGRFSRERLRGFNLRGRTLGVIGAGRVGLHVIRIGIGFGMRVIAYDEAPHPFYSELLDFDYVSFEQLLHESHVITLHVPLSPTTHHMINRETLALCREGIFLINTARGALIDPGALLDALDSEKVAGVGLDVLEDERVFRGGATQILGEKIAERVRSAAAPISRETSAQRVAEFSKLVANSQLLNRPEVVLTPHVAFNSDEAIDRLTKLTVENIMNYLAGRPIEQRCT